MTHAQDQAAWRKRWPERHRAAQFRLLARRKAERRLVDMYPEQFAVLFKEELKNYGCPT